ncbi:MAG: hypothetical protein WAU88_02950 [Candidatus Zixiibacteriota bacterium]
MYYQGSRPGSEAKRFYQRNMLMGAMASVGLAALSSVAIWLCEPPASSDGHSSDSSPSVRHIARTESTPHSRDLWLLPQNAPRSGFLGFVSKVQIRPAGQSIPTVTPTVFPTSTLELAPEIGEGPGVLGDQRAFGDANGTGTDDFGLPPMKSSNKYRAVTFPTPVDNGQVRIRRTKPDQPAQIKFNNPVGWPRKGRNVDRGRAAVLLYVDCRGNIDSCITVEDLPRNCDFALSLRNAIYESWIHPAVIGGREVATKVQITYDFVTDHSGRPVASAIISSENVSVHYPSVR